MADYSTIFRNNANSMNTRFKPVWSDWEIKELVIKESVALSAGTLLATEILSNTTTGKLVAGGAEQSAWANYVGILAQDILATDADYATSGKTRLVYVPCSVKAESEFQRTSGTLSSVDVWKTVEVSWSGTWLAVDTLWLWATIVKVITEDRGVCAINFTTVTETA